ncbi:MAG TPA: class III poly(R)-hydroxyalkanoic acid synthase subunit PhaE [Pseudoxanthomonas sp.]
MSNTGFGNTGDFEALARQYWGAWGEAMRQGGLGAGAPSQPTANWQQAVDWWSQLMPGGHSQANDAVGRFNRQARDWYGQMQQVAAQFAGHDSNAADVTQAWRQALGANADNPFPDMFKAMRGPGAHGLDEWLEQAQPYLDGFRQQSQRWQQSPAFGQYREHQERWQALQLAQQAYEHEAGRYAKLMMKCAQRAFEVFEDKLVAHEEPGRQITSARALFDLWIDAAEQAYADIALSVEFREIYGALTNAQMRLRGAIQREVEHMTGLFGMPTRTEIDSAHRKVADLERALRRASAADARTARVRKPAEAIVETPVKPSPHRARKPVAARPAAGKAIVRKPARKKSVSKKTAARKSAVLERAARSAAVKTKPAAPKKSGKQAVKEAPKVKVADRKLAKARVRKALPAPALASAGRVVSMKDWVARYAAANNGDAGEKRKSSGKKGVRK